MREGEGLVERALVPETPVRVGCHLAERGRALGRVVAAVQQWADEWVSADAESQRA